MISICRHCCFLYGLNVKLLKLHPLHNYYKSVDGASKTVYTTRRSRVLRRQYQDESKRKRTCGGTVTVCTFIDMVGGKNEDSFDEVKNSREEISDIREGKVFRFGAWLDDEIAGEGISKCQEVCKEGVSSSCTMDEKAYSLFCCGVAAFDVGRYDAAVSLFQKASVYGKHSSRAGGQYQLWVAQALDAAGKREDAKTALQKLKHHKDIDVRKASQQLLTILTAPKLKLNSSSFLEIPVLENATGNYRKTTNGASGELLRSRLTEQVPYAFVERQPQKYTLEWFIQKEPNPPMGHMNDNLMLTLAVSILIAMLIFFQHS